MMSNENYLLEFECDASKMHDALKNITTKEDILFIPNSDFLVVTNTDDDDTITIKLLDSDCFTMFNLDFDVDKEKYTNIETRDDNDQLIEENIQEIYSQPLFGLKMKGLDTLLSRMRGNVKFSFEHPKDDGSAQYLFIKDTANARESHQGRFKLYDSKEVYEVLNINHERYNARYMNFYDDYSIVSWLDEHYYTTVLKLFSEVTFNPINLGKRVLCDISLYDNPEDDGLVTMKIESITAFEHEFEQLYDFKIIKDSENTERKIQNQTENNTSFKIGSMTNYLEDAQKRHQGRIDTFVIVDTGFEEVPLSLTMMSEKRYQDGGTLHTTSSLYLQESIEESYE